MEQTFEGPSHIDVDNVAFWNRYTRELHGSQASKALKFVKYGCIRYLPRQNAYLCLPLNKKEFYQFGNLTFIKKPYSKDYNSSEYLLEPVEGSGYTCNCQAYQTLLKESKIFLGDVACSHTLALQYELQIGRWKNGN